MREPISIPHLLRHDRFRSVLLFAFLISLSVNLIGQGRQAPPWAANLSIEEKAQERFDQNADGWLNSTERKEARQVLAEEAASRPPSGRPKARQRGEPNGPRIRIRKSDVRMFNGIPAFDPRTVRTFFLDFEDEDWEKALTDFRFTDIEVPAKLTIDSKSLDKVGVHCRGASSFLFVPEGRKRSLNLKLDFVHKGQNFEGYRTFNLLNSNGDPTMLKAILYYQVAREYTAAPKANFVKLVINGEYWGVYVNTQQTDKDFVNEWWGTRGGALDPIFDIDAALKFLALESAFINDDGYWIRSSDYNLYRTKKGQFVIYPHDGNEAFYDAPSRVRGIAKRGPDLDPFIGAEDPTKVLLSRLLAVPALRTRYLELLRDMATTWLNWDLLGPIAREYQTLIDEDVKTDRRKLDSYEGFQALVEEDFVRGERTIMSLKTFSEQRREFLLNYPAIKELP
jgi:hypothetical protein